MAGTYDLLGTATASGGAMSLGVDSIPQTYNDLVVIFEACGDDSGNENMNGYIRFNDITSSDYVMQSMYLTENAGATRSSMNVVRSAAGAYFQIYKMPTGSGNYHWGTYKITIPNYRRLHQPSGTNYQIAILEMNCKQDDFTGVAYSNGFGWAAWSLASDNSVAINKVEYTGNNQSYGLQAGSSMRVYGIKNS